MRSAVSANPLETVSRRSRSSAASKMLERELRRKDKALAETAALLVLSKNELGSAARLWR